MGRPDIWRLMNFCRDMPIQLVWKTYLGPRNLTKRGAMNLKIFILMAACSIHVSSASERLEMGGNRSTTTHSPQPTHQIQILTEPTCH